MEPLQQEQENSLDLWEIAGVLLRRFWIIFFSGVLVAICALILTRLTTTPMYTSSTKMYILSKSDTAGDLSSSDLQLSATLAGDYAQLIKDRTVTESVISELGLGMSSATLANRISVNMPNSGRIITISVSDEDPYMACKIATTVRDMAALHIKEVMNSEAVNVVEEANIPTGQTMSNYKRNALMGFAAGIAIAIAIILLQYMMNDTVKNADDVERYLQLSVLGAIPIIEQGKKRGSKK